MPQRADFKLKAVGSGGGGGGGVGGGGGDGGGGVGGGKTAEDMDYKIRHVEHQVKNRDMVLDAIENRLARLEAQAKKS